MLLKQFNQIKKNLNKKLKKQKNLIKKIFMKIKKLIINKKI